MKIRSFWRWISPGIGIKRWLLLSVIGFFITAVAFTLTVLKLTNSLRPYVGWSYVIILMTLGVAMWGGGVYTLIRTVLAPYRRHQPAPVADLIYSHNRRKKGLKIVAIGGGTGLPSVLRAMKPYTDNITAIVTVADDGGSSGRLRREMGVLPPGDLRNNIVALADDESLMARLFQYRFSEGDLNGHAFGNLFIAALSGVAGGLENALIETARVLNIQGRVLPSTLENMTLVADVRPPGRNRTMRVQGESKIAEIGGQIERIALLPADAPAYRESVQAILDADIIVMGPGSLYTSILPNLMVTGIAEALRATKAYNVYVCNVATQPGETEGYSVAEHVMALERHIGRGVFQAVLANNAYPTHNAGANTRYVQAVSPYHEIAQRYEIIYADLTDPERPWRHDPHKLAQAILGMRDKDGESNRQMQVAPPL